MTRIAVPFLFLQGACGGRPADAMTLDEVQAVFEDRCGEGCHLGYEEDPVADLDLSPGEACADLVEVPSLVDEDWLRVKPGQADVSLLICKIDPLCILPEGSLHMPLGTDGLDKATVGGIAGWIDAGAPGCAGADRVPRVFAGATEARLDRWRRARRLAG